MHNNNNNNNNNKQMALRTSNPVIGVPVAGQQVGQVPGVVQPARSLQQNMQNNVDIINNIPNINTNEQQQLAGRSDSTTNVILTEEDDDDDDDDDDDSIIDNVFTIMQQNFEGMRRMMNLSRRQFDVLFSVLFVEVVIN